MIGTFGDTGGHFLNCFSDSFSIGKKHQNCGKNFSKISQLMLGKYELFNKKCMRVALPVRLNTTQLDTSYLPCPCDMAVSMAFCLSHKVL